MYFSRTSVEKSIFTLTCTINGKVFGYVTDLENSHVISEDTVEKLSLRGAAHPALYKLVYLH